MDAVDIAQAIREGRLTSRAAVESVIARMDQVNPKVNAVVRRFDEEALAAADAADAARACAKAPLPPLLGVPVTVKVNADQVGHPTDHGVEAHRDDVASSDTPVVSNLRKAGAIIVGRTNTPAFSMRWHTENALHGATVNPLDPGITPGGSSGGASAAASSGMGAIAHGNDIGGSIRYPAYCCGIWGLRPTYGRVPAFNETSLGSAMPIAWQFMAVQGPLTRNLADLKLSLEVMAAPDARDPRHVIPAPQPLPAMPAKVALVTTVGGIAAHPRVRDALMDAAQSLERAGFVVEEVDPPRLLEAAMLWEKMALPDHLALMMPAILKEGDDGIRRALQLWDEVFPKYTHADVLKAASDRYLILREWQIFMEQYPVLLTPVSQEPPLALGFDIKDGAASRHYIAIQRAQWAISALGLPAISAPTGRNVRAPMGVQIVAGRYREDIAFLAAEAIDAGRPAVQAMDPV